MLLAQALDQRDLGQHPSGVLDDPATENRRAGPPAGAQQQPRPPSVRSSSATARETEAWEVRSAIAASVKVPSSTTAVSARS